MTRSAVRLSGGGMDEDFYPLMDSDIPAERFPPRLEQLGFEGYVRSGVEFILPPVCFVPAGEFLMGMAPTPEWTPSPELLQHRLSLPAFYIGRFPVTVAEYACCVRCGHPEPRNWQTQLLKLDHPVEFVPFQDAMAYAAWLAELTDQPWRLPSEAEWEKAARGTDGRTYPWGNTFARWQCNIWESGIFTTTPVGSYWDGASPYGVHDMAGNVVQWSSSHFQPYPYTDPDEREEPEFPERRVLRGSSYENHIDSANVATRAWTSMQRVGHLAPALAGFRLVRDGATP